MCRNIAPKALENEENSTRSVLTRDDVVSPRNDKGLRLDYSGLFALASEQAGYFTAAQAQGYGISLRPLTHYAVTERFIRVSRGLYRFRDYLPSFTQAATLWRDWPALTIGPCDLQVELEEG